MSASQRLIPYIVVGGVGVLGGLYIWDKPLQEVTGKGPASGPIKDGRSQSVKDGAHKDGSPSTGPMTPLKYGGASPTDPTSQTVAGTSAAARKSGSVDHGVQTRADPKQHDGTGGGGQGVAEMRERKMAGQGLPSPQGGDTKAKPVDATMYEGEGGGVKKPATGRWWLGGW